MDLMSFPNLALLAPRGSGSFRLRYVLEPYEGPTVDRTLTVRRELVIGRGRDAHLRLRGGLISRCHVRVRPTEAGLEIEDVSTNGTLLNGEYLRRASVHVAGECRLLVGCTRIWLHRASADE